MTAAPTLATVQGLVEAALFVVPLLFFVVILVRGSRTKKGGTENDVSDS